METNFRKTNFDNIQSATIVNERSLFASVFTWMFVALAITTVCSLLFAYNPELGNLLYKLDESGNPIGVSTLGWVCMFAPLGFVLVMRFAFNKLSFVALMALFFAYAAVNGISFSAIFFVYNVSSIGYIFGAAAGLFGLMAVLGYTTKADLTKMGFYLRIGLIAVIVVMLINVFIAHSTIIDTLISVACVIIFTGLTAYHVQTIKELSNTNDGSEDYKKMGVLGALSLYLAFINLFLALLRLFGKRD